MVQEKSFQKNVRHVMVKETVQKHKKIKVTIPEGVDDGQQLRVSGQGEAGNKWWTNWRSIYCLPSEDT